MPKGPLPEWRLIYDGLLESADFGDVITYAQLDEALGRTFEVNRGPLYRAREHLGEMRHRWIEPVPRVGYRVIEPREHMAVAQNKKRRARRQFRGMVRVAEFTDLSRLTPGELVSFDSQARVNAALYMVAVHHERRISRIEAILRGEGKL
jgi:hypothetical protein